MPLITTPFDVARPEASSINNELIAPVVVGEVGVHVLEMYIKTWLAVGVVDETERLWSLVTVKAPAFVIETSPLGATAVAAAEPLPTQMLALVKFGNEPAGA
ncbi:hypothetical protein D3C87_1112550 [compost metagenome]